MRGMSLGRGRRTGESGSDPGLLDAAATAVERAVGVDSRAGLEDPARSVTWVGVLFLVCSAALVPWVVVVATTLPARQLSPNYYLAWTGLDLMEFAALGATGWFTLRRSPWMGAAAAWAASLLVTDAWFDVVTAPSTGDLVTAVAMLVLVEGPLTGVCLWVVTHQQGIVSRRLRMLPGREADLR